MEAIASGATHTTSAPSDEELDLVGQARASLEEQAASLAEVARRIDDRFARAVDLLSNVRGRVVVTGIGKSGHVGQKIAATLASTGTPAFFVHSAEAAHGDLGMITADDAVLLLSYSGETDEVLKIVPSIHELGVPTIALVGDVTSRLAKWVDVALDVGVPRETCPNNLAPTSSTLATMAMGDTIAVTLARLRRFQAEDFARFHPGGSLGRRLCEKVSDTMLTDGLPTLDANATVEDALVLGLRHRLGMCVLVDACAHVLGILGPRELEQALTLDRSALAIQVANSDHPALTPDSTMELAFKRIRLSGMPALPVVDAERTLLGVVQRDD